ncbi:asparagine synthase-related protein [Chryseobacterium sp. MP_3.2]|uniref:asparagine synthase-related protein n=1 Tax=Chryseobacterium sp. MP_3.2 TaxID=3071712 RepID=UPI002DFA84FC|nr:asparagine synthase (glutamine-hydrolyzing) [Chryseobacterium sp. MP_3.2]
MKKGFSITINPQNVAINSFITKENDDIYVQTSSVDILLEGVLLNKQKLLNSFALKDFESLIQELYFQKKEDFIQLLVGEFRGFIYDKVQQKLMVFTNVTSTQRVFYGKFGETIFIDTSLVRLSEMLKRSDFAVEPDLESLYQLLCFTNLPERKTPIQHIHKILDGHFLNINVIEVISNEVEYFNLSEYSRFNGNKNAAIDQIHEIFQESVLLEYDKDTEFGTHHLALLSGGLDSRVAMMYAVKNNRKPDNALCFSQSDYFDHTISEKIAEDLHIHYEFIPLDGGKFLKEIDALTEISEGMVLYTGGIHVQHAVKNMQYENFGLFHSGQIGDGVLGGFNTEPKRKKPTSFKIVENLKFLPQVQSSLTNILKNYESEELFLLRNVAYNRTILGAHVFQQKRYQTSPFMTQDFLKFAISLPEEWKFNHRFYIEWINKHCKEATNYRWERTLLKPNAPWKTTFGDQFVKRGFKILNEKILRTPQNSSMYPYQFYFHGDPQIQTYYQEYYDHNIHRLENYPELLKDVQELFETKDFNLKSKAINILSIFKLYF